MRRHYSPVFQSYLAFCQVRAQGKRSRELVLDTDFVFPTTLLPLAILVSESGKPVRATNASVQGYVNWIMRADDPLVGGTYVPVVRLPRDPSTYQGVLKHLRDLSETTKLFANNRDAYHYLLSELVDNIYQHADASRAFVMAQCYPKKALIEASFMDNGMTIPTSLARGTGSNYPPEKAHRAILDALRGKSAKGGGERGYGLRTSVRIANALGGEVLIVSGRGAVVTGKNGRLFVYSLKPAFGLDGTLVSIRLPDGAKRINLYKLLED